LEDYTNSRDVSLILGYLVYTMGGHISLREKDLNNFSVLARGKSLQLYVDSDAERKTVVVIPAQRGPEG